MPPPGSWPSRTTQGLDPQSVTRCVPVSLGNGEWRPESIFSQSQRPRSQDTAWGRARHRMENGVNDLRRSHTSTRISRPGNHLCKGFRLPSTLRRQEKILTTCSPPAPADRDLGACPHGETPRPLPTVSGARHLYGQRPRGDMGFRLVRLPRAQCQPWGGTKSPSRHGSPGWSDNQRDTRQVSKRKSPNSTRTRGRRRHRRFLPLCVAVPTVPGHKLS